MFFESTHGWGTTHRRNGFLLQAVDEGQELCIDRVGGQMEWQMRCSCQRQQRIGCSGVVTNPEGASLSRGARAGGVLLDVDKFVDSLALGNIVDEALQHEYPLHLLIQTLWKWVDNPWSWIGWGATKKRGDVPRGPGHGPET
jgi:hypothetical protein